MSDGGRALLRVIRSGPLEPALNLALDHAMLVGSAGAALRLYGWRPAGLSLGRFQDAAAFAAVPGAPTLVRRQTGGGAIHHADELTFALTLDARADWPIERAYAVVHDAVRAALARVGVHCRRLVGPGATAQSPRAQRSAWCFEHPGRHDLVAADGRKLVGSAQRRIAAQRPRVLHHGSIPWTAPPGQPFCASIADQIDPDGVRDALGEALADELAGALGHRPVPAEPSPAEWATARQLAAGFLVAATPAAR